jgi:glucose-6-phosphate 1-dehydrogenase
VNHQPPAAPTHDLVPEDHVIVLTFDYQESFTSAHQLEAYERLIHDALMGDRTLFTRADGIERLWEVSAPVLERPPSVQPYFPGSWGPPAADGLIAPNRWHLSEAA